MATNKQEKLHRLQEKYIDQLPDKVEKINKSWQSILQGNLAELEQLQLLVHTLAGSAGTFGFPAISDDARSIEETLRTYDSNMQVSEVKALVTNALQRIGNHVELGPDKPPSKLKKIITTPEINTTQQLIYVIEDDELLAKEISSQLSYYDYNVKTFTDSNSAIESTRKNAPTIMIIDVHLEGSIISGPEFASLYNEVSDKHIPSIFISSRDDWQARLSAVKANGCAYLTKPLDFNELLERLDRLTYRHEPEPLKVLIVDDMVVLAQHYAIVLTNAGMNVKIVSDVNELLDVLSDFQPELILMDVYMPQCTGFEAAKVIRQKDELLSVPIVFLSTESDPVKHLSAMKIGGDDFLQKPINDEHLVTAVRTRTERFRHLRSLMHNDGLTGLLNHVSIKSQLEMEIFRTRRQRKPLSFAMLDIDHFKQVNDTYGHPAGDRVIKSVARMLSKRMRKSDHIGRYGGEEFAIILPETGIENARSVLDDLRQNFSQIVQQSNENQFNCTFSVGVAEISQHDTVDSLIEAADTALYDAKRSGRDCVRTK